MLKVLMHHGPWLGTVKVMVTFDLHAVVVLVGNKTDLAEDRVVSEAEGQEYADRCSARALWLQVLLERHAFGHELQLHSMSNSSFVLL